MVRRCDCGSSCGLLMRGEIAGVPFPLNRTTRKSAPHLLFGTDHRRPRIHFDRGPRPGSARLPDAVCVAGEGVPGGKDPRREPAVAGPRFTRDVRPLPFLSGGDGVRLRDDSPLRPAGPRQPVADVCRRETARGGNRSRQSSGGSGRSAALSLRSAGGCPPERSRR